MADPSPARSSLTVLGGPLDGTRLVLDDLVDEILIGSDTDCRLALDLPGVSPIHARIWVDLAGVEVRDTRSPRGIYVNDDRVTDRAMLRDGDILWLGPPGDESSVMIHCRITPPPDPAAAPGPTVEEVFVEDVGAETMAFVAPPAPIEEYVEAVEETAPPPAGDDFFVAEEAAVAAAPSADEFVVDFAPPSPAAAPEPPPTPAVPADEAFFVEDAPATFVDETPQVSDEGDAFFVEAPPIAPLPASSPAGSFEDFSAPDLSEPASTPAWTPPAAAPVVPASAAPAPEPVLLPETPAASAAPGSKPAPTAAAATSPEPARKPAAGPATSPRPGVRRETPAAATPRSVPARRPAPPSRLPLYIGAGVLALAVLGGGGYFAMRSLGAPQLIGVSPARVHVGQVVVLAGKNFGTPPGRNEVSIGGRPATVQAATPTELRVEVPEVATAPGRDTRLPVLVRVAGRETAAVEVAVYQTPRIHGISPSVAMPGDEVTLAGAGWGTGAKVAFSSIPAEILEVAPASLRVKVPEIEGGEGTAATIVVTMGSDASNEAPFLVGRLPLITGVEPRTASAGDLVTISGRGFEMEAGGNLVLIGGVHALLAVPDDNQLKVVVPRVALGGGEVPIEIRVRGKEKTARSTITVSPAADPIDFRFIPEPFDEPTDRQLAVLSTGLGPALVVAAAGNKTAAQRALDFASRLNAAAVPLKASREATVEVRTLEDNPAIGLLGKPEALIEVAAEDAAAYNDDWTRQGRGGTVTRERLARWWAAVLKDLVLVLVRGEKPQFTAALSAPEGKVLGDIFQAARRTGQFGVPRQIAEQAKNPFQAGLRLLALRVPASVPGLSSGSAADATPAAGAFKLEGVWSGVEMDGDRRKYVTVTFRGNGGTLAFEGTVSISMNLDRVEQPQKGTVRYEVQSGNSIRYYLGKWDGRRIAGKISTDKSDKGDIGTFELSPR